MNTTVAPQRQRSGAGSPRPVAVVTGGGGGIGAAVCRRLAVGGVAVAVWDSDPRAAEGMADELLARGRASHPVSVDVSDPEAVARATTSTVEALGAPSMLVNNAGVRDITDVLDLTPDAWRRIMAVNLDGAFYCTLALARVMRDNGGGAIVNVASIAALDAYSRRTAYVASKTGLVGLTRSTALDLAVHGIRVNAVAPGLTLTPLTERHAGEEAFRQLTATTPLARWGTAEEVAEAVAFLLDERSAYITGVVLPVDGGASAARG